MPFPGTLNTGMHTMQTHGKFLEGSEARWLTQTAAAVGQSVRGWCRPLLVMQVQLEARKGTPVYAGQAKGHHTARGQDRRHQGITGCVPEGQGRPQPT